MMPLLYAAAAQNTAVVVMRLFFTLCTSSKWHPPQVSSTTRRSPGLKNFTNSALSFKRIVYVRSGFAEVFHICGYLGSTWALFLASSYAAEPITAPLGTNTSGLPPWQSIHPICTAGDLCMLGESISVWQDIQPLLFWSTCSSV